MQEPWVNVSPAVCGLPPGSTSWSPRHRFPCIGVDTRLDLRCEKWRQAGRGCSMRMWQTTKHVQTI